ncbi:hypothetical protein Val02_81770 [Virgisporangium aliadipatigenens]|uniref:Uncharacterized protein n=1 Tax=Virgisporangium aliadipatigenens TaxID=741659 RepID=A0A8J3YWZ3_9ACTN|nr:hypothetical protein [Virgisporangium aliadipatigenens]GIJ51291.1 hypothetical protein Val02_81770 [Virgisporangium aliadipatigenens]
MTTAPSAMRLIRRHRSLDEFWDREVPESELPPPVPSEPAPPAKAPDRSLEDTHVILRAPLLRPYVPRLEQDDS